MVVALPVPTDLVLLVVTRAAATAANTERVLPYPFYVSWWCVYSF